MLKLHTHPSTGRLLSTMAPLDSLFLTFFFFSLIHRTMARPESIRMFPQMVDSSGEKKGKEAAVAVTILLLVLSAFVLLIFYKSLAVRECLVTPAQAPNVLDERKGNEELTGIEEEPYEGAEIQPSGAPTPNIESIENEAEREHIQMLLWSKKAVLLLEYRKTPRSDCQADDCLYERSTGNSVIKEDFRVSLNGILKNGKMSASKLKLLFTITVPMTNDFCYS